MSSLQCPTNGFMNEDKSLRDHAASTSKTCSDGVALRGPSDEPGGRDFLILEEYVLLICIIILGVNAAAQQEYG